MRVITGSARGRKLEALDGLEVRPTSDRVKEAIFSIIQFHIEGRSFLDLYAGSGQMGIESLSRGASKATFVDSNSESIEVITRNLERTKLEKNGRVMNMDVESFIKTTSEKHDIVFLDPPYKMEFNNILNLIPQITKKSGIILCEASRDNELDEEIGNFVLDRQYRYGKIKVNKYVDKDIKNNE